MATRKSVAGIILDKSNKVLVLHRKLNWSGWELPKGSVEGNESGEQAMVREAKEETGLDVEITMKLPFEISYVSDNEEVRQKVFLAICKEGDVKLSVEHDKFLWANFGDAIKLLKHDNQKNALESAKKYLQNRI